MGSYPLCKYHGYPWQIWSRSPWNLNCIHCCLISPNSQLVLFWVTHEITSFREVLTLLSTSLRWKKLILKIPSVIYSCSWGWLSIHYMSTKKLFRNEFVEDPWTIFGGCLISHTRHFWPKGKKYMLINIKKIVNFFHFLYFSGDLRGGSSL